VEKNFPPQDYLQPLQMKFFPRATSSSVVPLYTMFEYG
jgi:hypothetical protein